jgi:N6-adenosine-specific RNA methylase IME4
MPYPTMSVAEIARLDVATLLSENAAHLYLWATNGFLREAFEIARAWGFKYSTALVWAKKPMGGGLGGCYGIATEYVLFCRRGSLAAKSRIGRNWFDWKRPYDSRGKPRHSAKPAEFFDMVERVSPGPYLELFAREPRPGWAVWGNEVEPDVIL